MKARQSWFNRFGIFSLKNTFITEVFEEITLHYADKWRFKAIFRKYSVQNFIISTVSLNYFWYTNYL